MSVTVDLPVQAPWFSRRRIAFRERLRELGVAYAVSS
jgi:hypothetical protein